MVNKSNYFLLFGLCVVVGVNSFPLRFSKGPNWQKTAADKSPFTFDDLFNSDYQPKSFSSSWIGDGLVYRDSYGNIVIADDVTTEDTRVLVTNTTEFSRFWVASDKNHVLLAYDVQSQWRHSFTASYRIYNHVDGSTTEFPLGDEETRLQFAQWASSGLGIFYGKNNDLYYQSNLDELPIQLTFNGEHNKIFNGIPDWLYEEEIFSTYYTTWWSPDTSHAIYAQFNTTNVPLMEFPRYGTKDNVYPELVQIPYPKAGDLSNGTNTVAKLFITNPGDNSNLREVPVPPEYAALGDYYFTQVEWITRELFYVSYSNRLQNGNNLYVYNASDLSYSDTGALRIEGGWYDPDVDVLFINEGTRYLRILSKLEGESGSWKHLAVGDTSSSGDDAVFLTEGQEEVVSISAYREGVIYFIATEGDRMKRHLNRINLDGSDRTCLTCDDVFEAYSYFSVVFSGSGDYYILSSLGPEVPRYDLYRTSDHTMIRSYEDNTMFRELTADKLMPVRRLVNLDIGGGERTTAEVWTPEDLQEGEMLPLVVETYGGPGSQRVYNRYIIDFHTHLVSAERVAYAFVDGRGTASRGDDFKFLLHRKLGTLEVEDQILGAQGLKDALEFVYPNRSAIWGWSYGGYLTANVMGNESDVFSCGIVGAALSDRRQYDTAHTERFMGRATPDDNQDGYERGSALNRVQNFQNKSVLVVHGTADDNVHFFSTAQLVKSLTEAEIQFRFQMYTDENHYFLGDNRHMYRLFIDFLRKDCWNR